MPTITSMVNKSLTSGVFANEWKTAIIRPLLKKNGLDVILKNYRPVSNLSYLSKIVEKCLNQFMKFLESNKLLPDYQSAYRRGFSTETALLKLSSDILWKMERQEVTALVALDLSAAFDTVDHSILSKVLQITFGVSESALDWFQSYLSSRRAEVHINTSKSQPRYLDFSVPQGSICGPVLYTVYASTLQQFIKDSGVLLLGYADDHSAYDSFNPKAIADEKRVITNLENVLVNINDWMNLNRLKLNPSKTEFVLFGSPQMLSLSSSTSINVVGASVNSSVCIKNLGCYLDEHLTFKKFVSEKCKTISLNLFLINNIRHYLTVDSCKLIVQSLVTSHLDYANSVLYGLPECTIKRFQLLQNRAAKLVLKWKSTDSSTEALKRLHWLPVYFRIRFKIACVVYKCLNDSESPVYLREMLSIRESPYSIRSISSVAKTLNVPAVKRKTFAARSFAISGPTVWNELPTDMRTISDFTTFKRQLKAFHYKCAF